MSFLRRNKGVTQFNNVRRSETRKSLNIKPLPRRIERSRLRWFGHLSRMPQERLAIQALLAKENRKKLVGRPRTRWTDYIKSHAAAVVAKSHAAAPQPSLKSGQ